MGSKGSFSERQNGIMNTWRANVLVGAMEHQTPARQAEPREHAIQRIRQFRLNTALSPNMQTDKVAIHMPSPKHAGTSCCLGLLSRKNPTSTGSRPKSSTAMLYTDPNHRLPTFRSDIYIVPEQSSLTILSLTKPPQLCSVADTAAESRWE